MKRTEKDQALSLRKKGCSMNEIASALNVSKASVSLWVRDVPLSKTQRGKLNARGFSVDAIEKRRINRIENTRQRHRKIIDSAKERIPVLTQNQLFLVGVALYWGEGGKTAKGMARIANADPAVIKFMMRFFREICEVPEERFRGHVHTFSHLNAKRAEEYWSEVSGITVRQFYKTYSKPSIASKGKKDSLPFGTFQIYVCDTELFLRISGWIERLSELGAEVPQPLGH
jgi:transcriptional regulator with XRE-family HTH domain